MDVQHRKQYGRKQNCVNMRIFALKNSHQAFVNDALGEDLLQQNRYGIQFHSQSETKIKERLSLREEFGSAQNQNCLGDNHNQTSNQRKDDIGLHRSSDIPKGKTNVRSPQIRFPGDQPGQEGTSQKGPNKWVLCLLRRDSEDNSTEARLFEAFHKCRDLYGRMSAAFPHTAP